MEEMIKEMAGRGVLVSVIARCFWISVEDAYVRL